MSLPFARCSIPAHEQFALGKELFSGKIFSSSLCSSSTGNDEMCNFYMMYWVEGEQLLSNDVCTSAGPPQYYFRHDRVSDLLFDCGVLLKIAFLEIKRGQDSRRGLSYSTPAERSRPW